MNHFLFYGLLVTSMVFMQRVHASNVTKESAPANASSNHNTTAHPFKLFTQLSGFRTLLNPKTNANNSSNSTVTVHRRDVANLNATLAKNSSLVQNASDDAIKPRALDIKSDNETELAKSPSPLPIHDEIPRQINSDNETSNANASLPIHPRARRTLQTSSLNMAAKINQHLLNGEKNATASPKLIHTTPASKKVRREAEDVVDEQGRHRKRQPYNQQPVRSYNQDYKTDRPYPPTYQPQPEQPQGPSQQQPPCQQPCPCGKKCKMPCDHLTYNPAAQYAQPAVYSSRPTNQRPYQPESIYPTQ